MQEGSKGLIIKLVLMALTALAGYLHANVPEAQLYAFATDLVDIGVLAYGFWRAYGQKLVPHHVIAVDTVISPANATAQPVVIRTSQGEISGKIVGALLLGMILFAPRGAEAATPAPSGPCNLATLFIGLSPGNFQTRLNACASADFEAALADANTAPVDHMAVSCLDPALKVVQSLHSIADGKTGLITAFQKFRRAKQSGMVGNCVAYVNSTTLQ